MKMNKMSKKSKINKIKTQATFQISCLTNLKFKTKLKNLDRNNKTLQKTVRTFLKQINLLNRRAKNLI